MTWDEGIHLEAAETEGVELFAHFIPRASLTALASRGLSIPAENGGNKAAALAGARITPRQSENTRRLGRIVAKDTEEVSSGATKRGLNELKQNASTPRKRRETNETNELLADNDGDPEPIPKSTLGPILVKVNFSYVLGTANVLKSFRSHTSSLYLKSPVALVRSIVAKSVVHSINASSRLHSYRHLLEYDIFVSTSQAGAAERPLDSEPFLRDHVSELQTHDDIIFVRTYIYLAKGGKRYARFEDAVADAFADAIRATKATRIAKPISTPPKTGSTATPPAPTSRGIIIGQLLESLHKDGRKNAVVAYLSIIGSRILCSVIDEDLEGNPLKVLGHARVTPENVDLLEPYASLGREGMKAGIKQKLMETRGATGKEGKGSKAAVASDK